LEDSKVSVLVCGRIAPGLGEEIVGTLSLALAESPEPLANKALEGWRILDVIVTVGERLAKTPAYGFSNAFRAGSRGRPPERGELVGSRACNSEKTFVVTYLDVTTVSEAQDRLVPQRVTDVHPLPRTLVAGVGLAFKVDNFKILGCETEGG